jgi:hypothetical protein
MQVTKRIKSGLRKQKNFADAELNILDILMRTYNFDIVIKL